MDITLQVATQSDIPMLIKIEETLAGQKVYSPMVTEEEWQESLKHEKVFLILNSGNIVGNVEYENKGSGHIYLSGLAIVPDSQGRGIGKKVMEMLFEMEDLKEANRIDLATHPENESAIKLYTSLGFKKEGIIPNYFDDGEPRMLMVLERSQNS